MKQQLSLQQNWQCLFVYTHCSPNGNASHLIRPISRLRPRPLPIKLISTSNAVSWGILLYCSLLISLVCTSVLNTSIYARSSVPNRLWPLKLYVPNGPVHLECHSAFSNKARAPSLRDFVVAYQGHMRGFIIHGRQHKGFCRTCKINLRGFSISLNIVLWKETQDKLRKVAFMSQCLSHNVSCQTALHVKRTKILREFRRMPNPARKLF
ncbi:hypothetical protein V1504DRAFT_449103 [Lipomyces starkeyi]